MCGIAGFIDPRASAPAEDFAATAAAMATALEHRGPDDAGVWVDPEAGVGLGFRRLAILDLTPAGHQPMISADGRYVIVFNGEIYNYLDLRSELERHTGAAPPAFRGHSDTETLLAGFVAWGIEATIRRAVGMFAIAVWDRQTRALTLIRDRLGEKPLYYGWAGSTLVFASELDGLRAHPAFEPAIDRDALALYFRYRYVPAPHSVYKGVSKLPPGTLLRAEAGKTRRHALDAPVAWWSMHDLARRASDTPFPGTPLEAKRALADQLKTTVGQQMLADVPVGAFLSGGVDSSVIVALMQEQSARPINTFTVGFAEGGYDEAPHARAIAAWLGTDHTEMYVTPEEVMGVIPGLGARYDEPFADSSQIPSVLISQLARQHVTVSLSGDGGDESFGGYNRYLAGFDTWRSVRRAPRPVRRATSELLTAVPPDWWGRAARAAQPVLPGALRVSEPADKIAKLAGVLAIDGGAPEQYYRALVSEWPNPGMLVPGAIEPATILDDRSVWRQFDDERRAMMYLDTMTYLPDDILVKVDRASMSVSLESRAPYLDHRVVELAWSMPLEMHISSRQGKHLLRSILDELVPRHLVERPKAGFAVPLGNWLRGPLRDWAGELLREPSLRDGGLLDPKPILEAWRQHQAGERNRQHQLWTVLMFQSWRANR